MASARKRTRRRALCNLGREQHVCRELDESKMRSIDGGSRVLIESTGIPETSAVLKRFQMDNHHSISNGF